MNDKITNIEGGSLNPFMWFHNMDLIFAFDMSNVKDIFFPSTIRSQSCLYS